MPLFLSKRDLREIVREELRPIMATLLAISERLSTQQTTLNKIIMTQAELKAALDAADEKVAKIQTEQTARFTTQSELIAAQTAEIQALKDALANGGMTSPEVDASLARLSTNLQAFDDTIPDA